MKHVLIAILLLFPLLSQAQINETFESANLGNWTQSPASSWITESTNVISGTYSLQHYTTGSTSSTEAISIPFGNIDVTAGTTTWRFQTQFNNSAPSGYNNWAVFLMADTNSTEMYSGGAINGYLIGINFSGTSDELTLWKITSGTTASVLNTGYDWQTLQGTTVAGIEVTRTKDGLWTIKLDNNGGFDNLVQQGSSVTNTDFTLSKYFGGYAEHSSTLGKQLFLDDISISGTIPEPYVQLSDQSISTANLPQGSTNNLIYAAKLAVDSAATQLNSVSLNTQGSYSTSDIKSSGLKLWLSNDALWDAGDTQLGVLSAVNSGLSLDFTALSQNLNKWTNYYILLTADIEQTATVSNTLGIAAPDETHFIFSSGTKISSLSQSTSIPIAQYIDYESTIEENSLFSYPSLIDYKNYLDSSDLNTSNSIEIASFLLKDGGSDLTDLDINATTIQSLSFTVLNYNLVNRIALYQSTTELAEMELTESTGSFSGLSISAADESLTEFSFRVSFRKQSSDESQIQISIDNSQVSCKADGSQLTSFTASSSLSGDNNRIDVLATKLNFISYPSYTYNAQDFSLKINALDTYDNIDLNPRTVTLIKNRGIGSLSSVNGLSQNLISGEYEWTDLQYSNFDNFSINALSTGLDTITTNDILIIDKETGFEDADAWQDHNYGDWSQAANLGTYYGFGISANSTPALSGSRGIGLNDKNDYLLLPPMNNPGKLFFSQKLSSDGTATSNKLALQKYGANGWETISEASTGLSTIEQAEFVINQAGSELQLRILRTADERTHYIDDFKFTRYVSPYDMDSKIEIPSTQIPTDSISSLATTPLDAKSLFSFKISDFATSDNKPTIINLLKIKNTHPANEANWPQTIAGIKLLNNNIPVTLGKISINTNEILIPITNGDLNIPNGTSAEMSLAIYLQTDSIEDNKALQFKIEANSHGCATDTSGTTFSSQFDADIVSNIFYTDVDATQLQFSSIPEYVGKSSDFSIQLISSDANGNNDVDRNDSLTIERYMGNGILSSANFPLLKNKLTNGLMNWTDLQYDSVEAFQIKASPIYTNLNSVVSPTIYAADNNSEILNPNSQITANQLSSLNDSSFEAQTIFAFKISDTGSSDQKATFITKARFLNANPENKADWTNNIQSAIIISASDTILPLNCSIYDSYLEMEFADSTFYVNNGTSNDFQLALYLNSSGIEDGKTIQLYIDSIDNKWETTGGSYLKAVQNAPVYSNIFTISVIATNLFIENPSDTLSLNHFFSLNVFAGDANKNIDIDANHLISLSEIMGSGSLQAADNINQRLVKGSLTYNYLYYNKVDTIMIQASNSDLDPGQSENLKVWGDRNTNIQISDNPIGAQSLTSENNSIQTASEVFKLKLIDKALTDTLPTFVQKVHISAGEQNNCDWDSILQGTILTMGTDTLLTDSIIIYANTLDFYLHDSSLIIPSDSSINISLHIYLKPENLNETQKIQFAVEKEHLWQNNTNYSNFMPILDSSIQSEIISIDIIANTFKQINIPEYIGQNENFSLRLQAIDFFENIDTNNNDTFAIELSSGIGVLSSESATNLKFHFTNGECLINDLNYSMEDSFTLKFTSQNYDTVYSANIYSVKSYFKDEFNSDLNQWNDTSDWIIDELLNIDQTSSLRHALSDIDGTSQINTLFPAIPNNGREINWQFTVKTGNWTPSSTNKFWLYLCANKSDMLSDSISGYVVGINYSSSSNLLSLWKVTNGQKELLIESNYAFEANATLNVKVTQSPSGEWKIGQNETTNFHELNPNEGSAFDKTNPISGFHGFVYTYSSTRAGQISFDNYRIFTKNVAPEIEESTILNGNTISIKFSENIAGNDAQNITKYHLFDSISNEISISSAFFDTTDSTRIFLKANNLATGKYTLLIDSLNDTENLLAGFDTLTLVSTLPVMKLNSAQIINGQTIKLSFSKTPLATEAEKLSNYQLKDSLNQIKTISQAKLDANDSTIVYLSTNNLGEGDYFLTIANLLDTETILAKFDSLSIHSTILNANIESATIINGETIQLKFSKQILATEAEKLSNYQLKDSLNQIKTISQAKLDASDSTIVYLSTNNLGEGDYFLTIANLLDTETILAKFDSLSIHSTILNANIESATIINGETIQLKFSKQILATEAEKLSNYQLKDSLNQIKTISQAKLDTSDSTIVYLSTNNLGAGDYFLTIANLLDTETILAKFDSLSIHSSILNANIESATIINGETIQLKFSKQILATEAEDIANYSLTNSLQETVVIKSALQDISDSTIVYIKTDSLTTDSFKLSINDLTDYETITSTFSSVDLLYSETINPGDIIISEIMPDPSPVVGLPEAEFIEIYNNKNEKICTKNLKLVIGTNEYTLETTFIAAKSFALIISASDSTLFNSFSTKIYTNKNYSLTNSGAIIQLVENDGKVLNYLEYTDKWYKNTDKDNGGWSLEKINLSNHCNEENNWQASNSPLGGTPVQLNSVNDENTVPSPLQLSDYKILNSRQIQLELNKTIDFKTFENNAEFRLNDSINESQKLVIDGKTVDIYFNTDFSTNSSNTLSIKALSDWCGNNLDTSIQFDYQFMNISQLSIKNEYQIKLSFSEMPNDSLVRLTKNFTIKDTNINPQYIFADLDYENSFILVFSSAFIDETVYQLKTSGIADQNNRIMPDTLISFKNHTAKLYDIVINELMINSENTKNLPSGDYIELYNRSNEEVNLKNWKINYGNYFRSIISGILLPNEYIILCAGDMVEDFSTFGNLAPLDGSLNLSSTGQTVNLYNAQNELIHSIEYSKDWYNDDYKEASGYSLEQIDFDRINSTSENWQACADNLGGTPGKQNSIYASNPDTIPPFVKVFSLNDNKNISIVFSESCSKTTLENLNNYSVNSSIKPISAIAFNPDFKSVEISFKEEFELGTIYTLNLSNKISDIAGNSLSGKFNYEFSVAQEPDSAELIINEVLYNPYSGGEEFIELFNKSDKYIDLSTINIVSADFDKIDELNAPVQLSNYHQLLAPKQFAILSKNIKLVNQYYSVDSSALIIENDKLPSLSSESSLYLIDNNEKTIEFIRYSDNWQFELLSNTQGISLERINPNTSATDQTKWQSASKNSNYATPGSQNSQYSENTNLGTSIVELSSKEFSPDNDGYNDRLTISYNLDKAGYTANMYILNSSGRTIQHLINNELLGTKGDFFWDGILENGTKAKMGIYILYFEFYHSDGDVKREKKVVVLSEKLH